LLVGILAFDKLSGASNDIVTNILLQIMHGSFLMGSILFGFHQVQQKQFVRFTLTLVPVGLFVLAFAGTTFGVRPSNLSLLLFDFYLILYYFALLLDEVR
jgi:hypothetical protein